MGRYPAEALDMKFEWMRAKQKKKAEREARKRPAELPVLLRAAEPDLTQMLRVPAVAKSLGVTGKTVQRWFARRGAVIVQGKHRATMLIPRRALDEWIREHTVR